MHLLMIICEIIFKTLLRKTTENLFTKHNSHNVNTLKQIITQFSIKYGKDYCINFNALVIIQSCKRHLCHLQKSNKKSSLWNSQEQT